MKPYHTIEMKSSKRVSDHSQVSDVYAGPWNFVEQLSGAKTGVGSFTGVIKKVTWEDGGLWSETGMSE